MVWRCALQEDEHIERDEKLLVGRGTQTMEQCISADEMLLVRIGYNKMLIFDKSISAW